MSNILLTDLDRELESRGLAFCRYADDCNIYVRSQAAAERVMSGIRVFLEKSLHLQINLDKSAVARPSERKFLGFSFTSERESRSRIAFESRRRLTDRVRELQLRGRGQSLARLIKNLNPLLQGWIAYFQISETPSVLKELDSWVRRRLRCVLWRQWKGPRTRCGKSSGDSSVLVEPPYADPHVRWCGRGVSACSSPYPIHPANSFAVDSAVYPR